MLVNVKQATSKQIITSLTTEDSILLETKNKVVTDDIELDVVDAGIDPSDATADASKIIEGYTAYIADGSKVTGIVTAYDYSYGDTE